MTIQHMIILNDYDKFVFNDAVDAFTCYKLLSNAKKLVTNYPVDPNTGQTDYNNPIEELAFVRISIQARKAI